MSTTCRLSIKASISLFLYLENSQFYIQYNKNTKQAQYENCYLLRIELGWDSAATAQQLLALTAFSEPWNCCYFTSLNTKLDDPTTTLSVIWERVLLRVSHAGHWRAWQWTVRCRRCESGWSRSNRRVGRCGELVDWTRRLLPLRHAALVIHCAAGSLD